MGNMELFIEHISLEDQIEKNFQYETLIHQKFCSLLETLVAQSQNLPKGDGHEVDTLADIYKNEKTLKLINAFLVSIHEECTQKDKVMTYRKCESTSEKWRAQGNICFSKRDYKQAYRFYTKSLKFAKPCGKNFVLAFSNRSAASYYANNKEIALDDLEVALSLPNADKLKFKLYLRMCNICFDLNLKSRLDTALKEANDSLKYLDGNVQGSSLSQLTEFKKKIFSTITPNGNDNQRHSQQELGNELYPKLNNENAQFVNASEKIIIKNSKIGRAVFATTPIGAGDILFVEKPYAVAEIKNQYTIQLETCDLCFKTQINVYPCESCSKAQYCDRTCFSEAWEKNHKFECVGGQMGIWSAVGVAHLATRVLIQGAKDRFNISQYIGSASELFQVMYSVPSDCEHDTAHICIYEGDAPGTSRDYIRVFYLNTNFNHMDSRDYVNYAMTSMMLSVFLERYTEFGSFLNSELSGCLPKNEVIILMGALILRHIGQSISNAHSIEGEWQRECCGYMEIERPIIATGIFASASIMNHSCDSNIAKSFFQTTMVVKASSSIQTNFEVFNSYGPRYTEQTYEERQLHLENQYGFQCRCSVCSDKNLQDYANISLAYKCPRCKGCLISCGVEQVCQSCKIRNPDISDQQNQLDRAGFIIKQAQESKDSSRKIGLLKSALDIKFTCLNDNHRDLRDLRENLSQAYWENGDKMRAIHQLQEVVACVQAQCRPNAVELWRPMYKLSSMMYSLLEDSTREPKGNLAGLPSNNLVCLIKQTLSTIQRTKNLHILYSGNWGKSFRNLCRIAESLETMNFDSNT